MILTKRVIPAHTRQRRGRHGRLTEQRHKTIKERHRDGPCAVVVLPAAYLPHRLYVSATINCLLRGGVLDSNPNHNRNTSPQQNLATKKHCIYPRHLVMQHSPATIYPRLVVGMLRTCHRMLLLVYVVIYKPSPCHQLLYSA